MSDRSSLRIAGGLLAPALVLLLVSCQDSDPLSPDGLGPLLHIWDGGSGGNSQFYFLPPLAPGPDEEVGDANPDLRPFVRVCRTEADEVNGDLVTPDVLDTPAGCVEDVTEAITGSNSGLEMTFQDGEYAVNLKTDTFQDDEHYRIEVWGLQFEGGDAERQAILDFDERWLFGWRDITDAPSVASCQQDNTQDFCRINYGQNVPVKAWIGDFVFCPDTQNCSFQFVQSGEDATLAALLGDNTFGELFIPGQQGTDFAIAFEPCSTEEEAKVDGFIDLPTSGPCVKTVPQPGAGQLDPEQNAPAVISFCSATGTSDPSDQTNHLTLHHFSTPDDLGTITKVEAWPHSSTCNGAQHALRFDAPAADERGPILRFVQDLGGQMLAWVAPQRLVASSAALDVGLGGEGFELRSFWKAAVPAKFEYATAGDHSQTALAGTTVALEAKVVDLLGNPVAGATVRWRVQSSPGGDADVDPKVVATTDAFGIAKTEATLSEDDGDNVFHAWGRGIASVEDPEDPDPTLADCRLVVPFGQNGGVGACYGPRDDGFDYGPFDPFMPLFHPHMDDNTDASGYEVGPVRLTAGILEFTIYGCIEGRGTPQVDGVLGAGEWDCAKATTFPVNLSGGSTVDAKLRWMNDDENFYLAVEVPGADRRNSLRIEWHRNAQNAPVASGTFSGTRQLGADVWEFHPEESTKARDMFIDNQCSGSSQTNCGQLDSDYSALGAAAARTFGGFSSDGNRTVYEIAHPLNSGDVCNGASDGSRGCHGYTGPIDLVAEAGADPVQVRGFFLSLRMGSGSQGNTVWPGFLKYLAVPIL